MGFVEYMFLEEKILEKTYPFIVFMLSKKIYTPLKQCW